MLSRHIIPHNAASMLHTNTHLIKHLYYNPAWHIFSSFIGRYP